jgi:hypothetical protein
MKLSMGIQRDEFVEDYAWQHLRIFHMRLLEDV